MGFRIEYAADYHTDQPHVLDFSKLPNEAHQVLHARRLLRLVQSVLGGHVSGCACTRVCYMIPACFCVLASVHALAGENGPGLG